MPKIGLQSRRLLQSAEAAIELLEWPGGPQETQATGIVPRNYCLTYMGLVHMRL